jgi:hypothetical protein
MPKVSLLFLLVAVLTAGGLCSAQDANSALPAAVGIGRSNPTANGLGAMPGVPVTDDVQKHKAIAANLQRQVEIRRDTEKMLQLTAELRDDLQQANHVLSIAAIKKAEQIEKLAHSVKSKMKASF